MENQTAKLESGDSLESTPFGEGTKQKIKELASFSLDPEKTLNYLINTIGKDLKREVFFGFMMEAAIKNAKSAMVRSQNLLSPEAVEALVEVSKYKQNERSLDNFVQMGNDLEQTITDNRRDRISSTGDDDRWTVGEQKKGINNAISDTARVSGYQNYDGNREVIAAAPELDDNIDGGDTVKVEEETEDRD